MLYEVTVQTVVVESYLVEAKNEDAAMETAVVKGTVLSSEVTDLCALACVPSQPVEWQPQS